MKLLWLFTAGIMKLVGSIPRERRNQVGLIVVGAVAGHEMFEVTLLLLPIIIVIGALTSGGYFWIRRHRRF